VVIAPNLPAKWASLRYRFFYHGQLIKVEVNQTGFTVENLGALPVIINDQPLAPGKPLRVTQQARRQEQGLRGVIFDLDGVLVTTDRYHYQAWKELADKLGIPFDEERNHALRAAGIKTAIASASKNAMTVLDRTGLAPWLDAVSDGTNISANKPDPQVFYVAAQRLRLLPWNCVGVEDAASGIESIHRAGMAALGVGEAAPGADLTVARPIDITVELLQKLFREHRSPLDPYLERHAAKVAAERGASYAQSLTHGVKK
jgi:beta-phosphoglucomutase-like phosphatase (HAD superfamily)